MCVENKTILFCYAGSSSAGYSAYGEQTPYGVGAGGGGSSYDNAGSYGGSASYGGNFFRSVNQKPLFNIILFFRRWWGRLRR